VVPVGSAAGWVHPASGYLLGHALRWTGELAAWLSDRETVTADEAWEQIWPGPRRRAWRLYRFGMEFLLTLDQAGISEFFERFFSLPPGRTERGGRQDHGRVLHRVTVEAPRAARGCGHRRAARLTVGATDGGGDGEA
jgi:hypothetical protein